MGGMRPAWKEEGVVWQVRVRVVRVVRVRVLVRV